MTALVLTADAGWLGGDALRGPVAVAVEGGGITWTGSPTDAPDAPRRHVDGVLLPGLVDHHVHTELIEVEALLPAGITTVVDLGGVATRVFGLVAESAQAGFAGPRVLAAGPFLTAPGGYPTDRPWAPDGMAWEIDSPEAAVRAVRTLAPHRPVTVKLALNSEAGPVLDDATVRAAVDAAHTAGLTVTAHTEGAGQAARAAEAGVDQLAHTPWTERLPDDLLRHLAGQLTVVSTLDIHGRGADTPELGTAVDNLRRFHGVGGRVCYGTDLGNGPLPWGVNAREIEALRAAGLTPVEVLRAITAGPGDRAADLVTVAGDPLADPAVLARAGTVLRAGRPVAPSRTTEGPL